MSRAFGAIRRPRRTYDLEVRLVVLLAASCGSFTSQPPPEVSNAAAAAPVTFARPGEPLVPRVVADLGAPPKDPAIDVVAWRDSTCAALASGEVAYWGGWKGTLHRLAGWKGVTGLAASSSMLCGRHRDGRVDCGSFDEELTFTPVTISGASNVRQLAVSEDAACVLERGGTVACWIQGGPAHFERVRGISDATQIVLGHNSGADWNQPDVTFGCALVAEGRVACFDMYRAPRTRIAAAAITPKLEGMTELVVQGDQAESAGDQDGRSSLCMRAGRDPLRCGTVEHGVVEGLELLADQAGVTSWFGNCAVRGDAVTCRVGKHRLLAAVALPKLAQVATGARHACAITDGRVACWGNNTEGQLGAMPTQDNATPALGLVDAVDLASSKATLIAVRANGQLAQWGFSEKREIDVPYTFSTITDALHVVASDELACVSHRGGAVSCWRDLDGTPVAVDALRGATELRAVEGGVVGRVGDGWTFVSGAGDVAPRAVPGTSGATDVQAANGWVCIQNARPGRVTCWAVPRKAGLAGARTGAPVVLDDVDEFALAFFPPQIAVAYLAVRHPDGRADEIVLDAESGPPRVASVELLATGAAHVIASGAHVCAITPRGPSCRGDKYELFNQEPFPIALADATKLVIDRGVCGLRRDHRVLCISGFAAMLGIGVAELTSPIRVPL